MTVADLLLHLEDLARFLTAASAKKVADELDDVRRKLAPFKDHSLKAFTEFLVKAEEYERTGKVSTGKKPAAGAATTKEKKPTKAEQAQAAKGRTLDYYHKATDPTITREAIVETTGQLGALAKVELEALAGQMGLPGKFRSKNDVIAAIQTAILDRKGAYERPKA